ncbi:hypothetical protein HYV81_00285 [Candidatus Woesearchaeota archaeon]|nr:hypothetical protein [Candidatus Woesearchaeota archaeon]
MKECVVCGKGIKSGYKYCWQHRNYSNEYSESRLLRDANRSFLQKKVRFWVIVAIIFMLVGLLNIPFIGSVMDGRPIFLYIWLFIPIIIIVGSSTLAKSKIRNRHPDYENYVRDYVAKVREESEYKESLLR